MEPVSSPKRQAIADILRPVHEDFIKTGMSEAALDASLQEAILESRNARRELRNEPPPTHVIDTPPPDCLK
jgi:hypothetical protein